MAVTNRKQSGYEKVKNVKKNLTFSRKNYYNFRQ